MIGKCSLIYNWAYQLEFSWLKGEGIPTLMGVDTGWTLPPSCPSSGVGNIGPPSPQGPNTILVLIVKDVLWSLLQCSKKTGEEGGGNAASETLLLTFHWPDLGIWSYLSTTGC